MFGTLLGAGLSQVARASPPSATVTVPSTEKKNWWWNASLLSQTWHRFLSWILLIVLEMNNIGAFTNVLSEVSVGCAGNYKENTCFDMQMAPGALTQGAWALTLPSQREAQANEVGHRPAATGSRASLPTDRDKQSYCHQFSKQLASNVRGGVNFSMDPGLWKVV